MGVVVNDGLGVQITVTGMRETILALEVVEPEVLTEMNKRIRNVGKTIEGTAARSAPVGRTRKMSTSYRTQTRSYKYARVVLVRNDTPQGNILEFAGSKTRGTTRQGKALIASLDREYGKPGRFLWESYDFLKDWAAGEIDAAGRIAEEKLQARLTKAGE